MTMREPFVYPKEQFNKLEKIVRHGGGSAQTLRSWRPILENLVSLYRENLSLATKPPCQEKVAESKEGARALKALGHRLSEECQLELWRLSQYDAKKIIPYGPRDCLWINLALFWRNQLRLEVTTGKNSTALQFIEEASRGVVDNHLHTPNALQNVIKEYKRQPRRVEGK